MTNVTISGNNHKEVCEMIISALHAAGHGDSFNPSYMQGHSSFLIITEK